jgi:hypothetical protein
MASRETLAERSKNIAKLRGGDPRWAIRHWAVKQQWKRAVLEAEEREPTGYVYFIQGGRGPIKIGYTRTLDVERRVAQLQTGCAYKLRILCVIAGSRSDERELHDMFAWDRMEGEWFRPSAFGLKELIEDMSLRLPV